MIKTFSTKLPIKKTSLSGMSQKSWMTAIAFIAVLAMPVISKAQYLEAFSTPNKGYLLNCVNDLTTVNWTLTPWDPTGTCQISPTNARNGKILAIFLFCFVCIHFIYYLGIIFHKLFVFLHNSTQRP